MPHAPTRQCLRILGCIIWGDLGPLTLYRDKQHKLVVFQKTWPEGPPSADQIIQRNKFRTAALAWNALTQAKRDQWSLAARRASLAMSGYNLFTWWHIHQDDHPIQAIQRQTFTQLLP